MFKYHYNAGCVYCDKCNDLIDVDLEQKEYDLIFHLMDLGNPVESWKPDLCQKCKIVPDAPKTPAMPPKMASPHLDPS